MVMIPHVHRVPRLTGVCKPVVQRGIKRSTINVPDSPKLSTISSNIEKILCDNFESKDQLEGNDEFDESVSY
jgi:hypothetical protein